MARATPKRRNPGGNPKAPTTPNSPERHNDQQSKGAPEAKCVASTKSEVTCCVVSWFFLHEIGSTFDVIPSECEVASCFRCAYAVTKSLEHLHVI